MYTSLIKALEAIHCDGSFGDHECCWVLPSIIKTLKLANTKANILTLAEMTEDERAELEYKFESELKTLIEGIRYKS